MGNTFFERFSLIILLLISLARASGQGTVAFDTYVPSLGIDGRATFSNGEPVGAGFVAQLYGGVPGTPLSSLMPLLPTTPLFQGYTRDIFGIEVPGIFPAEFATLVVRVYDGGAWETSACRGESLPITIQLSGGALPPSNLEGLRPFTVNCIPEPGSTALLCCGAFGLWLGACFKRWTSES